MANFARIIDNVAVDVSDDPENHFHPTLAAQFVAVPDEVTNGWRRDSKGKWSAPELAAIPDVAPVYPKVGPIAFQLLFTANEMAKAQARRAADATLAAFWKLIDDPRTDVVDLALTSVQEAVEYTLTAIESPNVAERKAAILSGVPR